MRTPLNETLWGELSRYFGKETEVLVKIRENEPAMGIRCCRLATQYRPKYARH